MGRCLAFSKGRLGSPGDFPTVMALLRQAGQIISPYELKIAYVNVQRPNRRMYAAAKADHGSTVIATTFIGQ